MWLGIQYILFLSLLSEVVNWMALNKVEDSGAKTDEKLWSVRRIRQLSP